MDFWNYVRSYDPDFSKVYPHLVDKREEKKNAVLSGKFARFNSLEEARQ